MAKPLTPKERTKDAYLRRTFGISLADYNKVLRHQNGRCAICKRPVTDFKNALAVDHNHNSGSLRGLLCWGCNKAISMFQDNAEKLAAAATYILSPPFIEALGKEILSAPGRVGTKKRAKLLKALKAVK